ncbi:D-alanine--D-alanine ligase [Demequina sp. B12]|uniref:D-alanine--D-alanine ligase family protein n=1 Tax=Demequina sp. B12 TaxID=2992757 RepID=UPI00237ACE43|nr:D-alanine--D-alanine ligase [Demequina sp. B12]MDE0572134.1 D-alanine--D-alanine ligase [Demequina sp. B12]
MKVLVLAGGLSHERDVSIRSGRRVQEALKDAGAKVKIHDVDSDLIPAINDLGDGVVWPMLHGASGEDGSLQGLLEMLDVPYVGTRAREARVAWVKSVAKAVCAREGIATPDYVTLPQSLFREVGAEQVMDAVVAKLGLPLAVKPARGGSALGVSLVHKRSELSRALVHCFAYDATALIEKAVTGIEVAVSVLGTGESARALPPVEISAEGPYDFDARYNPGRVEYFAPARLDEAQTTVVTEAALAVHRELHLRDLSRVDIILDSAGVPQVLDINVAPGLTETSLFPQAIEAAGLDLSAVYTDIVTTALNR